MANRSTVRWASSKLRITDPLTGEPPVTWGFISQMASKSERGSMAPWYPSGYDSPSIAYCVMQQNRNPGSVLISVSVICMVTYSNSACWYGGICMGYIWVTATVTCHQQPRPLTFGVPSDTRRLGNHVTWPAWELKCFSVQLHELVLVQQRNLRLQIAIAR